jgi:hypothetical protein
VATGGTSSSGIPGTQVSLPFVAATSMRVVCTCMFIIITILAIAVIANPPYHYHKYHHHYINCTLTMYWMCWCWWVHQTCSSYDICMYMGAGYPCCPTCTHPSTWHQHRGAVWPAPCGPPTPLTQRHTPRMSSGSWDQASWSHLCCTKGERTSCLTSQRAGGTPSWTMQLPLQVSAWCDSVWVTVPGHMGTPGIVHIHS